MAAVNYDVIRHYKVWAVLTQPLHVGSAGGYKEEVLIHPVNRKPFIQASGLAGAFRSYYSACCGVDYKKVEDLFGDSGNENDIHGSRVKFSDAFFSDGLKIERRPHVRINPATGSVDASDTNGAGKKFETEYIGAGAELFFEMEVYSPAGKEQEDADAIAKILSALNAEVIQLGGHKSSGAGYLTVTRALSRAFTMKNRNDRLAWAGVETLNDTSYDAVVLSDSEKAGTAYILTISGKTEGDLLTKAAIAEEIGENAPDSENARNAKGDYIVPGSSMKGVFRNRMEMIASYLAGSGQLCKKDTPESLIQDAFGYGGLRREGVDQKSRTDMNTGKRGNLYFADTVVGSSPENQAAALQHRIHIDKLTGGVMYGGKFSQKNVFGSLEIRIRISDENHPEKTCALLTMAARDLMAGLFNLGGGYNIGKGFLDVDRITITDAEGRKAEMTKQGISGDTKVLDRCMQALAGKEEASCAE